MIRIIYSILPALGVLTLLVGCRKSELTKYEQPDMVYMYKAFGNSFNDSVLYSFAIKPDALVQDTVKIPLRIMGVAKNVDRVVNVAVMADSSTAVAGKHFELLPTVVKAGEYTANIPVLVKKSADLQTTEVRLVVEIKESADFKPGVPATDPVNPFAGGGLRYKIKLNNIITKPSNWNFLQSFFGDYSKVKYLFIINVTGLGEFKYGPGGTLSGPEMTNFRIMCKIELANYEAANGPLMDENGLRVTFP